MDAEVERITRRLRSTPPSCVREFRLTPAELPVEWDDNCKSVWRLTRACGQDSGRVLGYPRKEGFLSPLAFDCVSCGKVTEILDTDLHGYHAEVAKLDGGPGSCKIRGEGSREPFPCPCGAETFQVTVGFVYWDAAFDLFLDKPELPFEDFFLMFLCYGRCVACGEVSPLADFGKL